MLGIQLQKPHAPKISDTLFSGSRASIAQQPKQDVFFRGVSTVPPVQFNKSSEVEAYATRYKDFLTDAVCAPLTAKRIIEEAEQRGFKPFPTEAASVKPGEKYYFNNDYESVALVVTGKADAQKAGFNIVGAHMDSPQLELKPETLYGHNINKSAGMLKLKTKVRGGLIMETWRGIPLGIAGRVYEPVLDTDGKPKLDPVTREPMHTVKWIKTTDHTVFIPRVPIHFDRTQNGARKAINPEGDLAALAGTLGKDEKTSVQDHANSILKNAYGLDLSKASRGELFLYPAIKPTDTGIDGSLIAAQGHDDRAMCFAAMDALFEAAETESPEKTSIAFFFDNEETGSLDRGGARSAFPLTVTGQLVKKLGTNVSDIALAREEALSNSTIVSADVAHGWEPDQSQYHDKLNAAQLNAGPAIKADSDGHYATTARGIAMLQDIAERNDVPIQTFSTNQDVSCGTTIGPMIAANTNAKTIDVGTPVLGMHSAIELAAKHDLYQTKRLFSAFFRNA